MLNGDFLNQQAEELAKRLKAEAGEGIDDQIVRGFQWVFARNPNSTEIARAKELIDELMAEHHLTQDQAMNYFGLFLFNLNEFVYVD